ARRLAALLRRRAEWYSHEGKHQAGAGQRDAAVKLNPVPARPERIGVACPVEQLRSLQFGRRYKLRIGRSVGSRELYRNIGLVKGADCVLLCVLGNGLLL